MKLFRQLSVLWVPDKNYFKEVKFLCEKYGTLLILDEVQTGFGRTGNLWGFKNFRVTPDIVVLGKGMSGGIYPISATVYHQKFSSFFKEDPFIHISTYGGSEIGCCAAMKVLEISKKDSFLANIAQKGIYFKKRFENLSNLHRNLGLSVRGVGLMMGLVFKDELTALIMLKILFDNGIYLVYSGNDPRVLQFLPPLIINDKDADIIISKFEKAFKSFGGS